MHSKHIHGIIKRKKFQKLSGYQIFVLPSCCISEQNLSSIHKCKMYSKDLSIILKKNLESYQKEHYMRINFCRFLHGPLIKQISQGVNECNQNEKILKLDINSAYIHYFTQNVILPTTEVIMNVVGERAHSIYEIVRSLKNENSTFFWFKVILLYPKNLTPIQKMYLGIFKNFIFLEFFQTNPMSIMQ